MLEFARIDCAFPFFVLHLDMLININIYTHGYQLFSPMLHGLLKLNSYSCRTLDTRIRVLDMCPKLLNDYAPINCSQVLITFFVVVFIPEKE